MGLTPHGKLPQVSKNLMTNMIWCWCSKTAKRALNVKLPSRNLSLIFSTKMATLYGFVGRICSEIAQKSVHCEKGLIEIKLMLVLRSYTLLSDSYIFLFDNISVS